MSCTCRPERFVAIGCAYGLRHKLRPSAALNDRTFSVAMDSIHGLCHGLRPCYVPLVAPMGCSCRSEGFCRPQIAFMGRSIG